MAVIYPILPTNTAIVGLIHVRGDKSRSHSRARPYLVPARARAATKKCGRRKREGRASTVKCAGVRAFSYFPARIIFLTPTPDASKFPHTPKLPRRPLDRMAPTPIGPGSMRMISARPFFC